MKPEIQCANCGWQGDANELVTEPNDIDDGDFSYCPDCGSENVYGISRVVGYFSVIGNWNISKQAELKRRQKGNYWHEED